MSDEHDSWFKSAFGVDLGQSLSKITTALSEAKETATDVARIVKATAIGAVGAGAGSFSLGGSVGRGGKNASDDVRAVQSALGIAVDGRCGPNTIAAIKAFQANKAHVKADGRIDVKGPTERALAGATEPAATPLDLSGGIEPVSYEVGSSFYMGDRSSTRRSLFDRWADMETSVVKGLSSAGDFVDDSTHAVTGTVRDGGDYIGEKLGNIAAAAASLVSEEHAEAVGSTVESGISGAAAAFVTPTELVYSGIAGALRAPEAFDEAVQTTAGGVETGNVERIIAGTGGLLEHGASIATSLTGPLAGLAGKGAAVLRSAPPLMKQTRTIQQIEDLRAVGKIDISDASMDVLKKLRKSESEIELPKGFDIDGQLGELQAATGHEFMVFERKGKLFLRRGGIDEVTIPKSAERVVAHSHPGKSLGSSIPSNADAASQADMGQTSVEKIVNEAGNVTYFSHLVDELTGAVTPYVKYIRRKAPGSTSN